jgi:hypothetical protein
MVGVKSTYSLVVRPPSEGLDYVNTLKKQLFNRIGWYHSCNAEAHMSILAFQATEVELINVIRQLRETVSYEREISLAFEGVGNYSNGAVFLKPSETCKSSLVALMKRIHGCLPIKLTERSSDPHISIGRQLNAEQVRTALEMFEDAALCFQCSNLVLRKFNDEVRQYDVYEDGFNFLDKPPLPKPQLSLF